MHKISGHLNTKQLEVPYTIDDFDYMVVELGGVVGDESKYKNNFCILPKSILIEQRILKSDTCPGKYSFCVCPPDYKRSHWSKSFWNVIPKALQAD